MNVLMQIRSNAYDNLGGDVVQLEKTKEHLLLKGVKINISTDLEPKLEGYDLVHLFNLSIAEDTFRQCLNAKRQGKKIILSSIYWNKNQYLLNNPNYKVKLAQRVGGDKLANLLMQNRKYYSLSWHKQKQILQMVDLIITTSYKEKKIIENDFGIKIKNYKVIPLGVDLGVFNDCNLNFFYYKYKLKNFILCVGRFENLKNQQKLIEIFGGSMREKLVFIGGKNQKFLNYYKQCRVLAKKYNNIYFFDYMPQTELVSAYAAAKVYVAPSWFESFGLTSLEAAACGTAVVVTTNSPLDEFFGDMMEYCNPADINSIRMAVRKAERKPVKILKSLRQKILKEFSWQIVSKKIYETYQELLKK